MNLEKITLWKCRLCNNISITAGPAHASPNLRCKCGTFLVNPDEYQQLNTQGRITNEQHDFSKAFKLTEALSY